MRKVLVLFMLIPLFGTAQINSTLQQDTLWEKGGLLNLNFSQVALTNWAGGGQNSISINGLVNLFANYEKDKVIWDNALNLGYGLQQQGDGKMLKSDDKIDFSSQVGKKINKQFSYSTFFGFKSQFTPGYNYPNDTVIISDFLAPAYVLLSGGINYKPKKWFEAYLSPLTGKLTVVNNTILSNAGAFGVTPGDKFRGEFGGMARVQIQKNLVENVRLSTKVEAFSNYSDQPDHIDVNWELLLAMKVNKFLTASLSTNLIYDHDVDIAIDENNDGITDKMGPRVQFKEVIAIGLSYKF
jgi:hypothetical protein